MKNDSKLMQIFKKFTDSEESLKRIPFYFFLICILLSILIFKLSDTNKYLKAIAEGDMYYRTDKEAFVEVITEEDKNIEDYVPLLEEISKSEQENNVFTEHVTDITTTTTMNNIENNEKETTTNKNEIETTNNSQQKKKISYVINTNSKKIHYADCTFAERTKPENKKTVKLTDSELQSYINDGHTFCKSCGGN